MTAKTFISRRSSFTKLAPENSLSILRSGDLVIYSNDSCYPFRVDSDFYYLTGIQEPGCIFVQHKSSEGVRSFLFIPPHDPVKELWEGKSYTQSQASENFPDCAIYDTSEFEDILGPLLSSSAKLYSVTQHQLIHTSQYSRAKQLDVFVSQHSQLTLHSISDLTAGMRAIKDDGEKKYISEAVSLTKKCFAHVKPLIKAGVRESVIGEQIKIFLAQQESHWSFLPIVAGGVNACTLHYQHGRSILEDGSLVLIDCGATSHLYAGDLTRTFAVGSTFSDRQQAVYDSVSAIQAYAIGLLKPGLSRTDYNESVKEFTKEQLFSLGLFSSSALTEDPTLLRQYCPHSISHSLGLDVHDPAPYGPDFVFQKDMIFTVEPGIYVREEAIGVRLEEDVLIGKECAIIL